MFLDTAGSVVFKEINGELVGRVPASAICLEENSFAQFIRNGKLFSNEIKVDSFVDPIIDGPGLVIWGDKELEAIDARLSESIESFLRNTFIAMYSSTQEPALILAVTESLWNWLPQIAKEIHVPSLDLSTIIQAYGEPFPCGDFCGKYTDSSGGDPSGGCRFAWVKDGICLFYMRINATWIQEIRLIPFRIEN